MRMATWRVLVVVGAMAAGFGGVVEAGPFLEIPIRWCGVEGAPSMVDPGALGEASTDDVLWRRHERPSDRIYIPDANITFRSAATAAIKNGPQSFPIIRDPSGSGGSLIGSGENTDAVILCRRAWMMGDPLYLDQNGNGVVDAGTDTLLSTGAAIAGVVDIGHGGAPLVAPPADLGFVDADAGGDFDLGERIYRDEDTNGVVGPADTLLVQTSGTVEGSVEAADVGEALAALPANVRYVDLIRRPPGTFNIGYPAVQGITGVSANDVEIPGLGFPVHGIAQPGIGQCGAAMDDVSQYLPPGPDFTLFETQLVGHEFGHGLSLAHGDGIDDDMDGNLDDSDDPAAPIPGASLGTLCDSNNMMSYCWLDEGTSANPSMTFIGVGAPTEGILTAAQDTKMRNHLEGSCDPGGAGGGAAVTIARVDGLGEIVGLLQHLDIAEFAAGIDFEAARTVLSLTTRRPFPEDTTREVDFHFLLDLDGNPDTGGAAPPQDVPTELAGAETIVSVRFDGLEAEDPTLRLYRPQDGDFESVDASRVRVTRETLRAIPDFIGRAPTPIPIAAAAVDRLQGGPGEEEGIPVQELIRITLPFDLLALPSTPFRYEVLSHDVASGLVDGAYSSGMVFEQPVFPSCRTEPAVADPGGSVTVFARGLLPGQAHHLLLGDVEVGQGVSDAAGRAVLTLPIPAGASPGPRLVTVGALAVTADCTVTVRPPGGAAGGGVGRHQVAWTLGGMGFETALPIETGFDAGFRYRRSRFADRWSWEAEVGLVDSATGVDDGLLGRAQAHLVLHTAAATAPVGPFVLAGAGVAHYDGLAGSDTAPLVTLGVGSDFRWTPAIGFRLDFRLVGLDDLFGSGWTTGGHLLWATSFSF